ncbi:hypothetical protein BVRB_9g205790 [Beta vulgaris subsp. vulgaris]|nr:hypothetical protein BVRB_9g205790 [Beta vulgaris subsp. vulgaris]
MALSLQRYTESYDDNLLYLLKESRQTVAAVLAAAAVGGSFAHFFSLLFRYCCCWLGNSTGKGREKLMGREWGTGSGDGEEGWERGSCSGVEKKGRGWGLARGYGFGLDPVTKDFKVVAIKTHCSTTEEDLTSTYPDSVYVYSLWTNSWRYIGDLSRDFWLEENKCYNYSNGFYYWLGSYREEDVRKEVVISFDMATDVYKEMHVPDYSQPSSNCIGIYGRCLAFFTFQTIDKIFDIWTLKEGSWIKKLTMGPFPDVWNPIGHWKDNCILLECHYGKLVLLDSDSQELNDLAYQYERTSHGVFAYMESLVSIKDKTMPGLQLEELKPEHDQSCCKN